MAALALEMSDIMESYDKEQGDNGKRIIQILDFHIENNVRYIEDMAIVIFTTF